MALIDLIPNDDSPGIKYAPSANTRRVFGRIVYTDNTATTQPPVVQLHGFPIYVAADEAFVYDKKYDAVLLDPTGLSTNAGIWYADIPVASDPDNSPGEVYATLSHPSWPVNETRLVPHNPGVPKVRWVDLAAVVPPTASNVVFIGGATSGNVTWSTLPGVPTTFPPIIGGLATQAVAGNDPRLTDQRVPTNGSVTDAKVPAGANINLDKTAQGATNKFLSSAELTKLSQLPAAADIPILTAGKLPTSVIPSIAITEFLGTVSTQAAMLALTGQRGDWCMRTDGNNVGEWRLTTDDPSVLANWVRISGGTSGVTLWAGQSGIITPTATDIAETTDRKWLSAANLALIGTITGKVQLPATLTSSMRLYLEIECNSDGSYPAKPTSLPSYFRIRWIGWIDPKSLAISSPGDRWTRIPQP